MKIRNILKLTAISLSALFFINVSLAATTAKVNVSTANLREKADSNSTILDHLSKDQQVEIIEKDGDWYKVKAKGVTGYLRQDLITLNEDEEEVNTASANATSQEENSNDTSSNTTDQEENSNTTTANKETNSEETATNNEENTRKVAEDTKLKIVPVINATDIDEVKKDDNVTVTEKINGWVCIETNSLKGWIREDKLVSLEEKEIEPEETNEPEEENPETEEEEPKEETPEPEATPVVEDKFIGTKFVNSELVNVRKEASVSAEVILKLKLNTEVAIYAELDEWYKVKVDGKEGYISKALLSDSKQEVVTSRGTTTSREASAEGEIYAAAGASIVEIANRYMGYSYVSGGAGPNSFDCSGFTQYVYRQTGINLNRTAAAQYSNGVAVSKSELQLGDLVMFGPSVSGINHVGIYIGNGRMIHAANPQRGVVTDTINSGYYYNNYVGARRVL